MNANNKAFRKLNGVSLDFFFSYPYRIHKILFLHQILKTEFLLELHVLRSKFLAVISMFVMRLLSARLKNK